MGCCLRRVRYVPPLLGMAIALPSITLIQFVSTFYTSAIVTAIMFFLFTIASTGRVRLTGIFVSTTTFFVILGGNTTTIFINNGHHGDIEILRSAFIPAGMRTSQTLVGLCWLATTSLTSFSRFVGSTLGSIGISPYFSAYMLSALGITPKIGSEYGVIASSLKIRANMTKIRLFSCKLLLPIINVHHVLSLRYNAISAVLGHSLDNIAKLGLTITLCTSRKIYNGEDISLFVTGDSNRLHSKYDIVGGNVYCFLGARRAATRSFAEGVSGYVPYFRPDLKPTAYIEINGVSHLNTPSVSDWLHPYVAYISGDLWDSHPFPTARDYTRVSDVNADKLQQWLLFFNVQHLIDREVSSLSGGERIKLGLCLAMAQEKPLLIIQHILSHLDRETCGKFTEWLNTAAPLRKPFCNSAIILCESHPHVDLNGPSIIIISYPDANRAPEVNDGEACISGGGASDKTPIMTIDNVELCRGDSVVLSNISLSLNKGEILAVTGPNGCGKSSLLMAISGTLTPLSGTISRLGAIGVTFQDARWQLSGPTAADEICIGLQKPRGNPEIDRIIESDCEWAEVKPGDYVISLDENQSRLLAVASMQHHCTVLLADEPTADVDEPTAYKIMKKLRDLADNGYGILVVAHDASALAWADRTLDINHD